MKTDVEVTLQPVEKQTATRVTMSDILCRFKKKKQNTSIHKD